MASVRELLAERAEKDAAIQGALDAFPDLIIDGEHLASPSLKLEDCDTACVVAHRGRPDCLVPGKKLGRVVVLQWGPPHLEAEAWLYRLRGRNPELYQQLVQSLGGG